MKYCPICERTYGDEVGVCDIDGSALRDSAPKQDALVGKTIKGRYRVIEKLGEGGMSVVYLGEQINVERKVALKVLHAEYARDEAFVRRFRQEAKLAASLNHRNVIQIYDFDQAEDGNLFIAMEYLVGNNLKEVIRAGTLEISRAVNLGVQIADGLSAAHRAGVIHRDIKPENIMVVGRGDDVKLMDFGIARLRETGASTRLTRAGMIMGTPAYMSPEQIEGNEINEKTDVYAFGIVLYEMLSKTVPFTAPTPAAVLMKHLKETPVPLRKLRRDVPAQLERIVIQALEKKPERRPAKMEEISDSLRQVERELAPITPAKTMLVTQPVEMIRTQAARQPSGARAFFGGLLRGTGVRAGAVGERRESRSQEAVAPTSENQPGTWTEANQRTVLETLALTRPMESFEQKRTAWKWIAFGGGTLVLVALAIWIGSAFYRQVPHAETQPVPAASPRETLSSRPAQIVSVAITADKPELTVKEHTGLRLSARYADGTKAEIQEPVQWASSNSAVVFVDTAGRAEAKAVGKAEVMARYKDMDAPPLTIIVTQPQSPPPQQISEPRLVSMRIQAGKNELTAREFMFLRLRGKYSDGQEKELKKGIRWESSDRRIAAVNSNGEVVALKEGSAQVVAHAGNIASEPWSLVVKPAIVSGRESEAIRDLAPDKPLSKGREAEEVKTFEPPKSVARGREPEPAKKSIQPAKGPDLAEYIKVARSYRERGEYSQALAELEKAGALDPKNKEIQGEVAVTKRACNAERTLGRPELRC